MENKEYVGIWSMIPNGATKYVNKFNIIITLGIFSWILFGNKIACLIMDEGKIVEDDDKWLTLFGIGAWPIYDEPSDNWKGGCKRDSSNVIIIVLCILIYVSLFNMLVNPTYKPGKKK